MMRLSKIRRTFAKFVRFATKKDGTTTKAVRSRA